MKTSKPAANSRQSEYISFEEACQWLAEELNGDPKAIAWEVAAWVLRRNILAYRKYISERPEDNKAILYNDFVFDHYHEEYDGFDYMPPLEKCLFRRWEVENFAPPERYVVGSSLIQRWAEHGNVSEKEVKHLIRFYCLQNGRLTDYYTSPQRSKASAEKAVFKDAPPIELALFPLSQIEIIEKSRYFGDMERDVPAKPRPTTNTYADIISREAISQKECLDVFEYFHRNRDTFSDRIYNDLRSKTPVLEMIDRDKRPAIDGDYFAPASFLRFIREHDADWHKRDKIDGPTLHTLMIFPFEVTNCGVGEPDAHKPKNAARLKTDS